MTKKRSTKSALLLSVLSLLMCVSMLVGSTFAWFTDSVTSANNIIKSGTLNVEMYWAEGTEALTSAVWTDASKGAIFNYDKWEPGYVEVRHIKIANEGTLALKYQLNIAANGEVSALADVIDVYFIDGGEQIANRTALAGKTPVGTLTEVLKGMPSNTYGELEAGDDVIVTLALKMQETAGNTYQNLSIGSDFTVQLLATQLTSEDDSFDIWYDEDAKYDYWLGEAEYGWYDPAATEYTLDTAGELAGLAALVNGVAELPTTFAATSTGTTEDNFKGKTITLGDDINLGGRLWTPIGNAANGFSGTFDGAGHTITNLMVKTDINAGLFGYALNGGNVKNLNIKGAEIRANDYAGAIMGRGYTDIDNCHVENVTVITTPYLKDGVYDGGAKAGGVIGQILEGAGNTVTNCSAKNVEIYAFRDLGGVVGMVHNNNSASGNKAEGVTLGYILLDKITADKNENAGAIYGRVQASATVSPAQDSAENQAYTLVYAVYDVDTLTSLANYVNNGTQVFDGKTVVMIDDIDLQNMAWTPIGKPGPDGTTDFSTSFKGTFDGKGHTVSNLSVSNAGFTGLFGLAYKATINNVKVNGAVINSNRMAGAVVGQLYGSIDNCHVKDAVITVVPNAVTGGYDNGDKVGGIVGWIGDNNNNRTLTDCSATNVTLKAYRDVGGIAGYVAYSTTIADNKVENITITADQITNYYGDKDFNANGIWGRNSVSNSGVGVTATNNTEANVSVSTLRNAANVEDLNKAIEAGANEITLTKNIVAETLSPASDLSIALNGNTLTVDKLVANESVEVAVEGGKIVCGEVTYPAVSVNEGGKLVMNNVEIICNEPCNLFSNGSVEAAEYVALQVFGGECELNNCKIEVNVDKVRYANSAYGIAVHAGSLVMNGGSVKVTSPGSTKAEYDYQAAFAGWQDGEKTITLNNVTIDAKYYLDAGTGNTVVNTTDAAGSWDGKCNAIGGTYTVNYK